LFLLGALDNLMCFWWCENNQCIVSGWAFGFACVRAGEICYARLSELFLAQTGSSRLSENGSNSPLFSFECSPERRPLAWARWASLSENSKYSLFSISLKWKFFRLSETPCCLSESSLAWARLTIVKCLYAPMIDLFTLLKHEIWCQRFIQCACVFLNFCCLRFRVFTCWNH